MRVIGIDPGTVCCGYGIVDVVEDRRQKTEDRRQKLCGAGALSYVTSGEIKANKRDALAERLKLLYSRLKEIIDEYKPSHIAIEKVFFSKGIQSAFTLGSMRGVAMLLAAQSSTPIFEYNSTELKQAVVGYGRAEKRQVKKMVRVILNIDSGQRLTEDSADALALCICHINSLDRLKYLK